MTRKRIILSVINEDPITRPIAKQPTSRKRSKVACLCCQCNGKLVDPRTKTRHELQLIFSTDVRSSLQIQDIEPQPNVEDEVDLTTPLNNEQVNEEQKKEVN